MSYLDYNQDKELIAILESIVEVGEDKIAIQKITDFKLIEGLKLNRFTETTKEDVVLVANNDGVELTDKQIEQVADRVMSKFDDSGYNEFIQDTISTMFG